MFYKKTIAALRHDLLSRFPGTEPAYLEIGAEARTLSSSPFIPNYLLWMCAEIESMDTQPLENALKAARWMGWIFAHAELLGIWTNIQTRDFVRKDCVEGLDRPHRS